ncbi:39S ribosomal protein L24, mitochondrial [Ascosphaera aggregata]|nr:39S ribosomal protein L24, mitochondrial [Ascosphaera aggregata]
MNSSIRSLILHGSAGTAALRNFPIPITPSLLPFATRLFSTTLSNSAKHTKTNRYLPPEVPAYPYRSNINFESANWGLYGGATLQSGNKISKGRNKGKTRRTWAPHIKVMKFYSEALGEEIELRVQHRVTRTIQKCGGLDAYLLGEKPARIQELGVFGWKLRWRVMNSPAMIEKFQAERDSLGATHPITYAEFKLQRAREYTLELEEFRAKLAEYEALDEEDKRLTSPVEWTQELMAKKAWLDQISQQELDAEACREKTRIQQESEAQSMAMKEQEQMHTETSSAA